MYVRVYDWPPPPYLCQGRRVHARVNRELNLTSLDSPQEKAPPQCDNTVLEQGALVVVDCCELTHPSYLAYLVG